MQFLSVSRLYYHSHSDLLVFTSKVNAFSCINNNALNFYIMHLYNIIFFLAAWNNNKFNFKKNINKTVKINNEDVTKANE